jgi:hypothetical protein
MATISVIGFDDDEGFEVFPKWVGGDGHGYLIWLPIEDGGDFWHFNFNPIFG